LQALAAFFTTKLAELQSFTKVTLNGLLDGASDDANLDTAACSIILDEQQQLHSELPPEWVSSLQLVADMITSLQLQAPAVEILSAALRDEVYKALNALKKDWITIRVLQSAERYIAAAPLRLLRLFLPRMVSLR
jgi:hypothetical protein